MLKNAGVKILSLLLIIIMFLKSRKLCTHSKNTVDHNLQPSWKLGVSGNRHWCHGTWWHARDKWAFQDHSWSEVTRLGPSKHLQNNITRAIFELIFGHWILETTHFSRLLQLLDPWWSHDSGFEIMELTSIFLKKDVRISGRGKRSLNKAGRGERRGRPGWAYRGSKEPGASVSKFYWDGHKNLVLPEESKLRSTLRLGQGRNT